MILENLHRAIGLRPANITSHAELYYIMESIYNTFYRFIWYPTRKTSCFSGLPAKTTIGTIR